MPELGRSQYCRPSGGAFQRQAVFRLSNLAQVPVFPTEKQLYCRRRRQPSARWILAEKSNRLSARKIAAGTHAAALEGAGAVRAFIIPSPGRHDLPRYSRCAPSGIALACRAGCMVPSRSVYLGSATQDFTSRKAVASIRPPGAAAGAKAWGRRRPQNQALLPISDGSAQSGGGQQARMQPDRVARRRRDRMLAAQALYSVVESFPLGSTQKASNNSETT